MFRSQMLHRKNMHPDRKLKIGAGGRNRTDTSVRKPDFASHYGFRHDAFALQHRRFDGLDFIFTMGFRR